MKTCQLKAFGLEHLTIVDRDEPSPGRGEVVVRIHAASLNYRDLMFVKGTYSPHAALPAVPLSDGAGEVVSIGDNVTRWKVGDRVCPTFFQGWLEGERSPRTDPASLGAGDLDGVLREYGAFDENGLVPIPEHLSFEEAATLPCAALTAWNALVHSGRVKAGDTVLTLGTGGVSIFAVQIARMHGARVITTSSSDDKLRRVRELGATETINYESNPEWDREVLRMTDGIGVDHVVEVGGAGTLARSISATRIGGHIAVIGVLTTGEGIGPLSILKRGVRLQGIFVGSQKMFEDMNRAVSESRMRPVIDRVFPFEQVGEALQYMENRSHFGKIVLKI